MFLGEKVVRSCFGINFQIKLKKPGCYNQEEIRSLLIIPATNVSVTKTGNGDVPDKAQLMSEHFIEACYCETDLCNGGNKGVIWWTILLIDILIVMLSQFIY